MGVCCAKAVGGDCGQAALLEMYLVSCRYTCCNVTQHARRDTMA